MTSEDGAAVTGGEGYVNIFLFLFNVFGIKHTSQLLQIKSYLKVEWHIHKKNLTQCLNREFNTKRVYS